MRKPLFIAVLALAGAGCTATPVKDKPLDAAMLASAAGPVMTLNGGPASARDWACTCECPKGCFQ